LGALIELINDAPHLSDDVLATRAAALSIRFDTDVSDPILDYPKVSPVETSDLLRAWTKSAGNNDRTPIRLAEMNRLKADRGVALYQFTLRRERFFREVTEEQAGGGSCDFRRKRTSGSRAHPTLASF